MNHLNEGIGGQKYEISHYISLIEYIMSCA